EDDIDALLLRQLAYDTFKAVFAVVDHVISAESAGALRLVVRTDSGDDRATHALGKLDCCRADAGAARMDEDRLARLKLRIVKQHVLNRAEGHGRNGCADLVNAGRGRHKEASREVHLLLRESVQMEAMHAADMLAKIVATFAARTADAAGACAIDGDKLTRVETGDARTNSLDETGSLSANDQRHLALGECHSPPAPNVDMVQRDGADAQRNFAVARGRGRRKINDFELAVGDQLQGAHGNSVIYRLERASRACSSQR